MPENQTAAVGDLEDPRLRQWIEEWSQERDVERRRALAWSVAVLLQGTLESVARAKVRHLAERGTGLDPHDVVNQTQSEMQEILRTFVKSRSEIEGGDFRAYVARCAWRIGSDLVKRSRHEREFLEHLTRDPCSPLGRGIPTTPSGYHMRTELSVVVARALAELCDRDRTIVLRRINDEASFDSIGFQLGMCRSVVRYYWDRVLPRLRRALGTAMGGDPLAG